MEIKKFDYNLSVCKIAEVDTSLLQDDICFIGKTDEELSLVCLTEHVPNKCIAREDGWKVFRIQGVLDFSLIGILASITNILAENGIGIFAVSTYNTDYVLVKEKDYDKTLKLLEMNHYTVVE